MLPYFTLAGITAILSWLNTSSVNAMNDANKVIKNGSRPIKWFVLDFIVIAALISFSALRFEVGTDFATYIRSYSLLTNENWATQIAASPQEYGYLILALSVKKISEGPEALLWVTSAITIIPAYITIKNKSHNPAMSIILFIIFAFYLTPFNIIRQGMAVSLNLWASTFLDKNKKIFILINAIAASLHITALYAALIQFVLHKKQLGYRTFIGIAMATLLAVMFPVLWTWIIDLFDQTSERYVGYLDENPAGIGTYILIIVRLALTAYAMMLGKSEGSGRYALYSLVGIAFLALGTQSLVISRMSDYFAIYLILLIPNQLEGRRDKYVHAVVIYSAGLVYFWQYISNWGDLIPYQSSL